MEGNTKIRSEGNQSSEIIKEIALNGEKTAVIYTASDGKVTANVFFASDTFWMTQKTMAELFGVKTPAISKHLKNIYISGELNEEATVSKMEIVQAEGRREITRTIDVYNLDAARAVGYRVSSIKATHFRIWATNTLREYIVKGFVLNDYMLKNGRPFGKDYFDELLEKIREIRASERRAYQKIADVFEQCSSDYRSNSEETQVFYQIVQNLLHFATTGQTAAEIIYLFLSFWLNNWITLTFFLKQQVTFHASMALYYNSPYESIKFFLKKSQNRRSISSSFFATSPILLHLLL